MNNLAITCNHAGGGFLLAKFGITIRNTVLNIVGLKARHWRNGQKCL